MKGADLAARILKAEGTKQVFTFPDDPLATTYREIGIRPYLAKTERGCTPVKNGREIGVCSEWRRGRRELVRRHSSSLARSCAYPSCCWRP
ncbi:MAG: hypothetical protein OEY31_06555 [Candidatus Bathyarchaeota archaeon]|nr:hypothetical protein [Candidatus Bathyarchaeota archaeon]